jgi:hypothetical protein
VSYPVKIGQQIEGLHHHAHGQKRRHMHQMPGHGALGKVFHSLEFRSTFQLLKLRARQFQCHIVSHLQCMKVCCNRGRRAVVAAGADCG